MLRCPKCGADARTNGYSKYIEEDNSYIRGRKCISCGFRFNTIEMMNNNMNDAAELYRIFSNLMREYVK